MATLKVRFPGGRYHATPWGHHVNEGLIEWPPSPWRLLRAVIACGFSSQGWTEIPPDAQQLINTLAGVLPSYRLPQASAAHSRHFMPIGVLSKGREQTTLVFDTWANVGDGELLIHWPCELTEVESALLSRLAASLGYLGRSESWVEAEAIPDSAVPTRSFDAFPYGDSSSLGPGWEQVSLIAAVPPNRYAAWQRDTTEKIIVSNKAPESTRKPTARQLEKLKAQREEALAPYPPDLLSCLTKDTAWWKQHGWSQPPGSERVLYVRRSDALQVGMPPRPQPHAAQPVKTMLLALTTASGNRSALPPRSRTLPQAELFHRALVALVARGQRVHCPELTGKDEHGKPLHDHHDHAHIFPVDLDGDRHLDHLIIYAKSGLGPAAQGAIRTLKRTWAKGGIGDIQLALVGHGDDLVLRQFLRLYGRDEELLGAPGGSRVWVSQTPFVPPRFLKPRGKNTLLGQVNAELASRRLPEAASLELVADVTRQLRHYVRRRNHGGAPPPIDAGYGLRLVFSKPLCGPLALGYASHYGLGLFRSKEA